MLHYVLFLREHTPGLSRFITSLYGNIKVYLNDIIRIRYYVDDTRFYTSLDFFIPKLNDKIEYDARTDEWYIVKDVGI